MVRITEAANAYKPKCTVTSAMAPSLTVTISSAATNTSIMDHFPYCAIQWRNFLFPSEWGNRPFTNPKRSKSLNNGNKILKPKIRAKRIGYPSDKSWNKPVMIETWFENMKNFLKVRTGANIPIKNRTKDNNSRMLAFIFSFSNLEPKDCFSAWSIPVRSSLFPPLLILVAFPRPCSGSFESTQMVFSHRLTQTQRDKDLLHPG